MSVVRQSWLSQNAVRNFPLADGPAALTTAGDPFPPDLIVDARLRADMRQSDYLELSGVTVGPALVTAAFSINGPDGRRAGGAASVVGPVTPGRPYPVHPAADGGVAGWVTFGAGIERRGSWRPAEACCRLSARAAQRLTEHDVESITRQDSQELLTGVVRLLGGQDVTATVEDRMVDGSVRRAIVLRLAADAADKTAVFSRYLGRCGARPESGTCDTPPLEQIGPVVPDCDGNVNILFDPPLGAVAAPGGGLAVGHIVSLASACGGGEYGSEGMLETDELACSSIGRSDGEGVGRATIVVTVPPGYEAGRVVSLDGEEYALTFGTYSAIFRGVKPGAHTVTMSEVPDHAGAWKLFYAGVTGSGYSVSFTLPASRTVEQVTFKLD